MYISYSNIRWSPKSYQNNMEKYEVSSLLDKYFKAISSDLNVLFKDDDEKRQFNLKESLWFCMSSITPQGGGEVPKNLSGKLVAATWWLFRDTFKKKKHFCHHQAIKNSRSFSTILYSSDKKSKYFLFLLPMEGRNICQMSYDLFVFLKG